MESETWDIRYHVIFPLLYPRLFSLVSYFLTALEYSVLFNVCGILFCFYSLYPLQFFLTLYVFLMRTMTGNIRMKRL